MFFKKRPVADFVALVLNTDTKTLQILGCKVNEKFEDLQICREVARKRPPNIEYIFIPSSTDFYNTSRSLIEFAKKISNVHFHPSSRLIICIDLGDYAIALPKQCTKAMYDFSLLRCYARNAFGERLDLIENVVNSIENTRYRCEVLAFIYKVLEEYKKCQEELISINAKILRYFINTATEFLINVYPYLPEQIEILQRSQNSIEVYGIIGLPSTYGIKGKIALGSQHMYARRAKLSPQDDLIIAYIYKIASFAFNQRLMTDICLCSPEEFDALINEIEEKVKDLANLMKNRKRIEQLFKEIESRINGIRVRCQQHRSVKEELDTELDRINTMISSIKEELRKCSVQVPKETDRLAQKALSVIINECFSSICID